MTEKTISIEGLDSVDVYGVNDRKLDRMRHYFPEVRIIARGTDIRLEGPDEQVELLSQRIQALTAILRRGGGVSDSDLERMLDWQTYPSELEEREPAHNEEYYNIVYGNEGRIVKARTRNQRRLVDEYYRNDLIFALGPAGTGKTYTAIALAVRALKNKEVKKLILTRPAVEAGERLGFLPGDSAAGLHEGPDPGQRLRHPGRGPEHLPGTVEDVPHPHGLQRQVHRHR